MTLGTSQLSEVDKAIHSGLNELTIRPHTPGSFQRRFGGNELLEGLQSKGYVVLDGVMLSLTVQGVKHLLYLEGHDVKRL